MPDPLKLMPHAIGQGQATTVYGQIAPTLPGPSSFSAPLNVIMPDWSTDYYFVVTDWPTCHGSTLPTPGADCLLIYDSRGNLRCVWWGLG